MHPEFPRGDMVYSLVQTRCCLVAQSCLTLFDPWTVAHQASLSMDFPWQEYWNGLPFPSPGDLPNPGIRLVSLLSPALAGGFFTPRTT